jgi:hypothetical protein
MPAPVSELEDEIAQMRDLDLRGLRGCPCELVFQCEAIIIGSGQFAAK